MRILFLLLPLLFVPITLYEDRSLSVMTDKQVYALGDTVTMTISIQNEKCREHNHYLDLYIYDSSGLLVDTILGHTQEAGLTPAQFPYQVKYKPPRVEAYTVKLYVFHGYYWGARYVYLEDTAAFHVVSTLVTSQTTSSAVTSQTTTILVAKTETLVTTITSTTIVSLTITEVQTIKIDWTTPVSDVARTIYQYLLHLNPVILIVVGALVLLSRKLAKFVGIVSIILGVVLLMLPYLL